MCYMRHRIKLKPTYGFFFPVKLEIEISNFTTHNSVGCMCGLYFKCMYQNSRIIKTRSLWFIMERFIAVMGGFECTL